MKGKQIPLPQSKKLAVTQSNKLIEARYSLTLNEQRIVLFMISLIQPEDEDFKDYEIKVSDIVKLAGLKNKNIYAELKELLVELRRKGVVIPESDGYLVTGWLSSAKYKESEGIVQLSFDRKLKPYLLKLKEQFTKYHLYHVTHFQSSYTIRIYMLIKQYEKVGFREFDLVEFREILGIASHQYKRFSDFRKRVITVAQSELSKKNNQGQYLSDITFHLETIRTGRKISRLRFVIEHQRTDILQSEFIMAEENKAEPPIIAEYETYGIDRTITLAQLQKQGERPLKYCLKLFKEKLVTTNIKNPSGYLLGMLNNEAGKENQAERDKKEKVELERKKQKAQRQQQRLQERKEKLGNEFTKQAVTDYLSGLSKQEKENLLKQAKQQNPMFSNLMTSLESPMCLAFLLSRIPNYGRQKEEYIKVNSYHP